ncbi:hypothetical protein OC861_001068 [Tilletia horrida]|nr:hypothetical protein OC861_001068 [Tilletia horrida]
MVASPGSSRTTSIDGSAQQTRHSSELGETGEPSRRTMSVDPVGEEVMSSTVPAKAPKLGGGEETQDSHPGRLDPQSVDSRQSTLQAQENQLEKEGEVIWVDFEPGDPEDPFEWSHRRKLFNVVLCVFFTIEVAQAAGSYVSGIDEMERDLGYSNRVVSLLGVSLYALGFSLPPLVLAPFSEALGRKTIYVVTHFIWTILFLGIGFAKNIETVLILRFLQGAFGSTGSTMVGGTISDMYRTHSRGVYMAFFSIGGIGGTGIGPAWAGWVAEKLSWRWIQWITAAWISETRGSVLLSRRAAKLRKETGDQRYRARAEEERASMATLIKTSLTRPLWLLVSEPVVLAFSLWIAFAWGIMYALLESLALITALHNLSLGQTGLVFLSLFLASIIGFFLNFVQEALYRRNVARKGPEARLYAACVGAVMFPVGCLIYGWTSFAYVSLAGPIVGVVVLMVGIYSIYLAVFNYLADSYLIYASSALAAQSFARNVFGFAFPLFVTQMYKNLHYQWASTLIALLGAVLGVIPFILYRWGDRIRAKSNFSLALQKAEEERQRAVAAHLAKA